LLYQRFLFQFFWSILYSPYMPSWRAQGERYVFTFTTDVNQQ
jgi:hypothetical protein